MISCGIDLSLTATGVARMAAPHGLDFATVVRSTPDDASIHHTIHRVRCIVWNVMDHIDDTTRIAVIEAPSYESRGGKSHERAYLWWTLAAALGDEGIRVVAVAPRQLKRYATGKGTATKQEVLAHARDACGYRGNSTDIGDATILAAIGMRVLGHPVEPDGPLTRIRAEIAEGIFHT